MEDKELEELKFKFEQHKLLDDKFIQNASIPGKQLFAFNLGVITLVFFALQYSLEFALPKVCYLLPLMAIICCASSAVLLMRTYSGSLKVLAMQKELIFQFTQEKSDFCDTLDATNDKYARLSFYVFIAGFVITIFSIFLAIFTIDFKKKDDISKIEIINCNMANEILKDTFKGMDSKSFVQNSHLDGSQQNISPKSQPQSQQSQQHNNLQTDNK